MYRKNGSAVKVWLSIKKCVLGSLKFLHSLTAQNFFFFRCEISKHQNRGKTFLREGMKYLTPAFVKEKSSLCGTIWHLITRFVSYEGFTEILSRLFCSKSKMYPELRRWIKMWFVKFLIIVIPWTTTMLLLFISNQAGKKHVTTMLKQSGGGGLRNGGGD